MPAIAAVVQQRLVAGAREHGGKLFGQLPVSRRRASGLTCSSQPNAVRPKPRRLACLAVSFAAAAQVRHALVTIAPIHASARCCSGCAKYLYLDTIIRHYKNNVILSRQRS